MTLPQVLAGFPALKAHFETMGIHLTLADFLTLYQKFATLSAGALAPATGDGPVLPTTLTLGADANNAPYGVTLAGWSPQDHQGADLRDPKNAKYLVYAYLVANAIAPTTTWAPAAVAALQSVMPSVPWRAEDTETLIYGDEFVHPADNGHGMAPGTFNPAAAPKEFFWGAIG